MPTVWIPAMLRGLTDDRETVDVPGTTVRELIEQLDAQFPGVRQRLCDGDRLRPGLAVAVGTQVSRLGLSQTVPPDAEVHFLPAIAGG